MSEFVERESSIQTALGYLETEVRDLEALTESLRSTLTPVTAKQESDANQPQPQDARFSGVSPMAMAIMLHVAELHKHNESLRSLCRSLDL